MKKIKIKICGLDKNSETTHFGFFILDVLKKNYIVELSEDPDYIFYNDSSFEHLKYNGIKIWYTGENVSPNFNLCDYAIGFDYMDFGDRYFRLPVYIIANFYKPEEIEMSKNFDVNNPEVFTAEDLKKKTGFCSFVYSNYLADDNRKIIFEKLNSYKKVDAGGKYLNNIGGIVPNKLSFESSHKFSIAFENSSRIGYTTEKILNSLFAKTIPIYWGNPSIGLEFNTKRIINCHDYKNFDEVVERVKEIDNNDELYLRIINEPILAINYSFGSVKSGFEKFLKGIFNQPLELAKRASINPMHAIKLNIYEHIIVKHELRKSIVRKILSSIYRPFKYFKFINKFKVKFFKKYSN